AAAPAAARGGADGFGQPVGRGLRRDGEGPAVMPGSLRCYSLSHGRRIDGRSTATPPGFHSAIISPSRRPRIVWRVSLSGRRSYTPATHVFAKPHTDLQSSRRTQNAPDRPKRGCLGRLA